MIQLYCHNDINEARGMAVANMKYFSSPDKEELGYICTQFMM